MVFGLTAGPKRKTDWSHSVGGGRLEKSNLTVGQMHPMILHRGDRLTKLICEHLPWTICTQVLRNYSLFYPYVFKLAGPNI